MNEKINKTAGEEFNLDQQDSNQSGLSRWSRRKLSSQHGQQNDQEEEQQINPLTQDESIKDIEETEPEKLLCDSDMPSIESLDESSDFSGFLSSGVSDDLRRLALRKLFSQPKFNLRDGLDDYDDDYRHFTPMGDIVTSDMKHETQMALLREQDKLLEPTDGYLKEDSLEEGLSKESQTIEDQADNINLTSPQQSMAHHDVKTDEDDIDQSLGSSSDHSHKR